MQTLAVEITRKAIYRNFNPLEAVKKLIDKAENASTNPKEANAIWKRALNLIRNAHIRTMEIHRRENLSEKERKKLKTEQVTTNDVRDLIDKFRNAKKFNEVSQLEALLNEDEYVDALPPTPSTVEEAKSMWFHHESNQLAH